MTTHTMNVEGNGTASASRGRLWVHAERGLVHVALPDRNGTPGPLVDLTVSDATSLVQILSTVIAEAKGAHSD